MTYRHLSLLLVFFSFVSFGQNEASNWYFGQNAGVQFDLDSGTVTAVTNGQLNTLEGCTSISDTDGNLLFYSDGITVWNRNHVVMQGGFGLKGDPSSTSSGLIVPQPQNPDLYYIFTVDEPHHWNTSSFPGQTDGDGVNDGLMYTLIDITLNSGLGAVVAGQKNVSLVTFDTTNPLQSQLKCSEKITAVKADDCSSIWVITHFVDRFYAFKIDENGVNNSPVESVVGPIVPAEGYRRNALGYLKASPDGSKLVAAHQGFATSLGQDTPGGVYLFDFDNDTGVVTNSMELYNPNRGNSPYGVEFSAENRRVYATIGGGPGGGGPSQLVQWDLEATDIPNSLRVVNTSNTISAGAIQLGIDKKIYRAQLAFTNPFSSDEYLGVINNPELLGTAANYNQFGVLLDVNGTGQNKSRIGLPPFIQSLFNSQIDIIQNGESTTELLLCEGDTYTLTAENILGADYAWTKDGLPLSEDTFELEINNSGFYEVFIEPNSGDCPIEGNAVVNVFDVPVANMTEDIIICDDNNDGISTFNLTLKNNEVLGLQDPSQFSIDYFRTESDAIDNQNPLNPNYINTNNPEEIFARVSNTDNLNCFDITSFNIQVFDTPVITLPSDTSFCDTKDDPFDGISLIELDALSATILGPNQSDADFTVSYHNSMAEAETNTAPLVSPYCNTTAFSEAIFIRLENNLNTDCFVVDSFTITINPSPQATDATILQCDEDGVPDGRTVFNITEIESDIANGEPTSSVTYFLSQTDAESDLDEIDGTNYPNTTNPQTIIAKITNTTTSCINYAEVTLQVSVTDSNDATIELCDDDGTEDGFREFDLSEADAQVLQNLPAGLETVYYGTNDDALLEVNPLNNLFVNTIPFEQTIYVRVENDNACYGISEVFLRVKELPNVEIENETIYCLNTFPERITLTGGIIGDIPNNYFYDWSTGETTSEIQVNEAGIYTVRVTNVEGCFKDRRITVLASNIATIEGFNVMDASQNNTVTVLVSGEGDYEYALDNVNGPYQDSNVFDDVRPGIYTVYVRDKNNCGISEDLVSVVGFPRYFTPNGDGNHDFWQVQGISSQFQPNTIVYIFDRFGKLLAEIDPTGSGWDGTYNNNPMPTSDYWFSVKLEDGREFSSHFTLKR
ncbi:T9SS type B sorting domain-containing protein [Winogradskyella maritima]|uniref:T9SS type B sorting domain-containing protein n=1 Tax=Winogradskyella maritima TaxID=1517766 RepID=A0ABV8AMX6_9FLAO|nr:T9SS type B sorting domain-containing protein [Winogradskyella maritima]